MPLPPALLERLKKRNIIQVVVSDTKTQDSPTRRELSREETGGEEHEEILAEDYSDEDVQAEHDEDDDPQGESSSSSPSEGDEFISDEDEELEQHDQCIGEGGQPSDQPGVRPVSHDQETSGSRQPHESVLGCPNKYNIYHQCCQYCVDRYEKPESLEPSLEQRKQLALVLRTFPMSNEWTVVYDPGVRTFYFWNIISHQVSWYPPGMSTFSSPSADQIRKLLAERTDQ